jgi:hypothetical protein
MNICCSNYSFTIYYGNFSLINLLINKKLELKKGASIKKTPSLQINLSLNRVKSYCLCDKSVRFPDA